MDDRLVYHTSMEKKTESVKGLSGATVGTSSLKPWFPALKSIQYYKRLQSTDIALDNLKKLNNKLDENNIVTLAYLANNSYINEEDRENYNKKLKEKALNEYHIISTYVNDIIRRNENSSINESECIN